MSISKIAIIFATLVLVLFSGCGNSGTAEDQLTPTSSGVLQESDILENEVGKNSYVSLWLEARNSADDVNDTQVKGVESITYRFDVPIYLTLHIDDNTPVANKLLIDKNSGNVIAMATKGSDSEKVLLTASKAYLLLVTYDDENNATHHLAVSLFPKPDINTGTPAAVRSDGITNDTTTSEIEEYACTLKETSPSEGLLVDVYLLNIAGGALPIFDMLNEYGPYFYYTACTDFLEDQEIVNNPQNAEMDAYSCIDWEALASACSNGTASTDICTLE